ncbi:MAG: nuclear transport factor 2 family protein [Rhodospirillales bacterium]|nr:nuclear transport factor 2 family protein [Rhodospirillales bacterium]
MTRLETLRAYAEFFEKLTVETETLVRLDDLVTDGVRFVDPFHDIRGREAMKRVLASMLRMSPDVRFRVHDLAVGDEQGFLSWTMTGTVRRRCLVIDGASVVVFGGDDRIAEHLDRWDSASTILTHVPVLRSILRAINTRIARAANRDQ